MPRVGTMWNMNLPSSRHNGQKKTKPLKKQLETTIEDGDFTNQGKEPIVEDEEDQPMEIDKSSLPLKLWSSKKVYHRKGFNNCSW
jgi:hypothetical protein